MKWYRKIKKGFTLLELLAVISLMSLLINWCIWNSSNYRDSINRYELDYVNNSILSLLNNAKQYCRKNEVNGMVNFDIIKNCIIFASNTKLIQQFDFPQNFKLISVNAGTGTVIYFNSAGLTNNACTISFKDPYENIHTLTVCVGTCFVEIHE